MTATPEPACGGRFQCENGECIDHEIVCNGNPDCSDASDEPPHCRKYHHTASAVFTCSLYSLNPRLK